MPTYTNTQPDLFEPYNTSVVVSSRHPNSIGRPYQKGEQARLGKPHTAATKKKIGEAAKKRHKTTRHPSRKQYHCNTPQCPKPHFAKGFCRSCYRKWRDESYRKHKWSLFYDQKGKCALCGQPVSMSNKQKWSQHWCIDHIDPSGDNSYENLQLAHIACNSAKGDKITSNLR